MSKPLAIDLFCGLGGWTEGLGAEGYLCVGYDIEEHQYGDERYPGQLVLQDVRTLHGAQFKDAALIVASPPCQEFSYMAMPWKRAKQIARALRGQDEFPEGYRGSRTIGELTALFDACFRIQREASEAAGHHIPMVVENVRGAEPWVGKARWNFGSYYLWGDVPALMPKTLNYGPGEAIKRPGRTMCYPAGSANPAAVSGPSGKLHWQDEPEGRKNPGFRFDGSGRSFQSESVNRHVEGVKVPRDGARRTAPGNGVRFTSREEGRKGGGGSWANGPYQPHQHGRNTPSGSKARKAASAKIAKIPFALSSWIARAYLPAAERVA